MGYFQHPHLVRGVVHTSLGAFQIERGIADLPDDVGEALGWMRVPEPAAQPLTFSSAPVAAEPATPAAVVMPQVPPAPSPQRARGGRRAADASPLGDILTAVKSVVRGHHRVEVPARGIDVAFDAGVVAICRSCEISWEVSGRHLKNPAWWSCPRGCAAPAGVQPSA